MKKTNDALEILSYYRKKDPALQRLYEEEGLKLKIALLIREYREKLGLTQKQLAERMGVKQPVVSRLEDANYESHNLKTLEKAAKALNCRLKVDFIPKKAVA